MNGYSAFIYWFTIATLLFPNVFLPRALEFEKKTRSLEGCGPFDSKITKSSMWGLNSLTKTAILVNQIEGVPILKSKRPHPPETYFRHHKYQRVWKGRVRENSIASSRHSIKAMKPLLQQQGILFLWSCLILKSRALVFWNQEGHIHGHRMSNSYRTRIKHALLTCPIAHDHSTCPMSYVSDWQSPWGLAAKTLGRYDEANEELMAQSTRVQ